jgi:hypothetical protein
MLTMGSSFPIFALFSKFFPFFTHTRAAAFASNNGSARGMFRL